MQAMVIDDSRATRAILARTLEELGYEVVQAGHGREALELLEHTPDIDLALVDWNMPVMNGLELVRAVRADDRFASVTLVMVTTEGDSDHMVTALEAGADEYVMKPFTAETIEEKLCLLGLVELDR